MENKESFLKKIGANIKAVRKEKRQEVKEAANALGITVQAYGAIENGKVDLNITRVFEIANFYEVDFSKLLSIKNGDVFNYTSQNNKGGYHVQKLDILKVIDERLVQYLENELKQSKNRVTFLEEELGKIK